MDLPQEILQQLGPWGFGAFLAWWIIKTQRDELKDERAEKKALVERIIDLSESMAKIVAEFKAELKGGG
jgi:hypothetical protein